MKADMVAVGVDIGKLYAQTGMFTYDPASVRQPARVEDHLYRRRRGVLLDRGDPIHQLAEQRPTSLKPSSSRDTVDLDRFGNVRPSASRADHGARADVGARTASARRDRMSIMVERRALAALYHDLIDINDPISARSLGSDVGEGADACCHVLQVHHGPAVRVPTNGLGYMENFLHMMFSERPARNTSRIPCSRAPLTGS